MSIKLIIFDMDGTLVDCKSVHFEAFNKALEKYDLPQISYEDHLKYFDGLSTKHKMLKYEEIYKTKISCPKCVWAKKQLFTEQIFSGFNFNVEDKIELIRALKKEYSVVVATNSIRSTTEIVLKKTGLINEIERSYCNEDVVRSKPHPEMFLKAMIDYKVAPHEVLIVEDSPNGVNAAISSGAHYLYIKDTADVNLLNISKKIEECSKPIIEFLHDDINIVIPMAGLGSRFQKAGYLKPKPLIDVMGKTMIEVVLDSLKIKGNFVFLVLKEHVEKYNIDDVLRALRPNCKIVVVDKLTEGAACTLLLAKEFFNNDKETIIANSDQWINWNPIEFLYYVRNKGADGAVITFLDSNPKWSFVKTNDYNEIIEIAEKNPISNKATLGIYYAKKGADLVWAMEEMIRKNIRTNNEFYFFPSYSQLIEANKKILNYELDNKNVHGLGTPDDLDMFRELTLLKNIFGDI